jgi:hypothetical membrane protein
VSAHVLGLSNPRSALVQAKTLAGVWGGLLAPAVVGLTALVASLVATQYSHIDDSICQLGAQDRPQAWIMSLGFIGYAALVASFAARTRRELGESGWGRTASKAMLLHAVYVLLLAFVQANPAISGAPNNAEGAVHIFLARGAMAFLGLAMLATAKHLWLAGRDGLATAKHLWLAERDGLATYSVIALAAGALMAVLYISQAAVEIDGVFERVMLLLAAVWLVALSLRMHARPVMARR